MTMVVIPFFFFLLFQGTAPNQQLQPQAFRL